jgi:hypothetical protein
MKTILSVLAAPGVCVMMIAGAVSATAQQSSSTAVDKSALVLIPGVMTGPGTTGPAGILPAMHAVVSRPLQVATAVDRADCAAERAATRGPERSAIRLEQGARDDGNGLQGQNTGEHESTIGDGGRAARGHVPSRKMLRPAFDAYGSLDSEQQRRLDILGPGRHGSRW